MAGYSQVGPPSRQKPSPAAEFNRKKPLPQVGPPVRDGGPSQRPPISPARGQGYAASGGGMANWLAARAARQPQAPPQVAPPGMEKPMPGPGGPGSSGASPPYMGPPNIEVRPGEAGGLNDFMLATRRGMAPGRGEMPFQGGGMQAPEISQAMQFNAPGVPQLLPRQRPFGGGSEGVPGGASNPMFLPGGALYDAAGPRPGMQFNAPRVPQRPGQNQLNLRPGQLNRDRLARSYFG